MKIPLKEEDTQRAIIDLFSYTHIVLQTSHRSMRFACPSCHALIRNTGGYGATKGVPDLLIRHAKWPSWAWLGMEVKGSATVISPEQKDLAAKSAIVIVRSLDEAMKAVKAFDDRLMGNNVP